jgi:hypothetical protein
MNLFACCSTLFKNADKNAGVVVEDLFEDDNPIGTKIIITERNLTF